MYNKSDRHLTTRNDKNLLVIGTREIYNRKKVNEIEQKHSENDQSLKV